MTEQSRQHEPVSRVEELKLSPLFADGMVLQRNREVPVWGTACPGTPVAIWFHGACYETVSDALGSWLVKLPKQPAGGPHTMNIRSGGTCIILTDILFGDVWVCAGQSNMQNSLETVREQYPEEIAQEAYPPVRQFGVPERYDFDTAHTELEGGIWLSASPEAILGFSATGYFFAKELAVQEQVPIGLIQTAVGGSPLEAWLPVETLQRLRPELLEELAPYRDRAETEKLQKREQQAVFDWHQDLALRDAGLQGSKAWFDEELEDCNWETIELPADWSEAGLERFCGSVWLRRTFEVSAGLIGKPARLRLGTIVDSDAVYVNGTKVGETGYMYPTRVYPLPLHLLREGRNTIVIRTLAWNGQGGVTRDKPFELVAGGDVLSLKGKWRYRVGASTVPQPGTTFVQWKPLGLYNGMIAPLHRAPITGVIWYQGESNVMQQTSYADLFRAMIQAWREKWGQGSFPFLFVQLPLFGRSEEVPGDSLWARLREQQSQALEEPQTGMAVALDTGEWNDIHPARKREVGERLALWARRLVHGWDGPYSGPLYQNYDTTCGQIRIRFDHADGGLAVLNAGAAGTGRPEGFAIAGADRRFVWAEAELQGDTVVVWSEEVPEPVAVRYAWADNPAGANLCSGAGLPASPFRTDRWE